MMNCGVQNTNKYGIALRVYIIRKSDGTGSVADENYQLALFDELDDAFNPHGIYFLLNCISYIDDTFIYNDISSGSAGNTAGGAFASSFQDDNFMTLVIHGGRLGGGFAPIGGNYAYAGAGFFDNDRDRWDSAVVHELGHALGLYHTHHGNGESGTPDLVDGSICCDAGDFICDTPPDPNDILNVIPVDDCTWPVNQNLTDPDGVPYEGVLLDNYMSYYPHFLCPEINFTSGQGSAMRNLLETLPILADIQRPDALFHETSTTITSSVSYDTDVRVIADATAIFDGVTVAMPAFRRIKVDAKARLIGLGSTFTSSEISCASVHPFWRGIEVDSDVESSSKATVVSMDNSVIELANNGIYYPSIEDEETLLPLVFLSNMTFRNNRVSLNLANDNPGGSLQNQGFVQICSGCDFTVDADYPSSSLPKSSEIKLAYNRDFWCLDCDLSLPALPDADDEVPAIDVLHTQLALFSNCPVVSSGPFDCADNVRSTITNYELGVRLTNSDHSQIEDVTFVNVQHAVSAAGSPSLRVRNSRFDVNSQDLVNGYAIQLDASPMYLVEKNNFVLNPASTIRTSALRVVNCGETDAFVSDNYFQDFGREVIQVIGQNSSINNGGLSGLRIYCNDFNNPDVGPSVAAGPHDIGLLFANSNIARFQGDNSNPAGNKFSAGLGTNVNDFHIRNRGSQPVEYTYSDAPNAVRAMPVVSSGVVNFQSPNNRSCLDFTPMPGGVIVTYDTVSSQYIEIDGLESQTPGFTDPTARKGHQRKISGKYVNSSVSALRLEGYLEKDSNSVNALPQLLGLAGMRPGYLAEFHQSLISARYGNHEELELFIKTEPVPTVYGADFETGVRQYYDVFEMAKQAGNDSRRLRDLNTTELDSFRSVAISSTEGLGRSYSVSVLAIFYDEFISGGGSGGSTKSAADSSTKNNEKAVPSPASKVLIFPNPTPGLVSVNGVDANEEISVVDLHGRVVYRTISQSSSTSLDISRLPRGIYLIQFFKNGVLNSRRVFRQ